MLDEGDGYTLRMFLPHKLNLLLEKHSTFLQTDLLFFCLLSLAHSPVYYI